MNLGSLAGGFAQGLPYGAQLAQQQQQNQGLAAYGNALGSIYGGQQSQQGTGGPLGNLMSMFGGQQQVSPPPQAPSGGAPAGPSPGGGVASASPALSMVQAPAQGQGGGQQQTQAQPSAQGQGMQDAYPRPAPPQQPQQQGQQPGQGNLDLPTLVRALVARGVQGRQLGAAVQNFIPLLNAQGLQQYRGLMLNPNVPGTPAWARTKAEDPNSPGSPAWGRDQAALDRKAALAQKAEEFRQRLESVTQRHTDDIQLKTQQIQSTTDRATAGRLAADVRAAIRAKQTATQHEINAAQNLDEDSKAALQKQAAQDAEDAQKQLDDALKAQRDFKPAEGGAKAAPKEDVQGASVKITTPEQADKLPPGTIFELNGQTYKR